MKLALANAARTTEDVDYISAYGPGHPVLDSAEVRYIKEVFGDRAYSIPISSIKGVTGNPLAAGGPFQVAACALSFRDQMVAPTANYEVSDPSCDLDFVPQRPRKLNLNCILMNVRGLGGSASSLVVDRVRRMISRPSFLVALVIQLALGLIVFQANSTAKPINAFCFYRWSRPDGWEV